MEKLEASGVTSLPKQFLLNDQALLPALEDDSIAELRLPVARERRERPTATIEPMEGFCVKCKVSDPNVPSKDSKVFVNMMYDDALPPPGEPLATVSDEGLAHLLETGGPETAEVLKIPMSLGGPRPDKDKSGEICRVCDIVINSAFFQKADASLIMKTFLITVTLDGLEQKYDLSLNRDNWVILKNKKYFGTKASHVVRDTLVKEMSEPVVEMLKPPAPAEGEQLLKETTTRKLGPTGGSSAGPSKPAPKFELFRERKDLMKATFELPDAARANEVDFQLNDDHVVLTSPKHHLDIFLPVKMDFKSCDAEFDANTRVLTVKIPLKAS